MKPCIFCESPAAVWPKETSSYVKKYNLCEWHMANAIKTATYYSKKITDENIDHWICVKIKKIAKEGGYARCKAQDHRFPDNRCFYKQTQADGLCDRCRRKNKKTIQVLQESKKLKKALKILRSA